MKLFFVSCIAIGLSSCFLFKDYKKKEFAYTSTSGQQVMPIIVPKHYVKKEVIDSAGNREEYYHYANGAILYNAYVADTSILLQTIDTITHQPQFHRLGGIVYKGIDSTGLYYREIKQGHFRSGYRFVPGYLEFQFDSVTNYASLQKH